MKSVQGQCIEQPRRFPWWWYPGAAEIDRFAVGQELARGASGQHWVRAIEIDAPNELVLSWVTQLRRAPYSYGWVDNFGRHSPQTMDPTLTDISPGDSVMTIFTTTAFVPNRSLTVVMNSGLPTALFGHITVHYEVEPGAGGVLLIVDMIVPQPPGPLGSLRRYLLAWGDLIMMRKQLKEFKWLAERDSRAGK
jgi:hypothetical protein